MATTTTARLIAGDVLTRIGPACYRGDLLAVGSELVQADRYLPQLEQAEPERGALVRAAYALVEQRLRTRFGIDPQAARAAALRHAYPHGRP